MGRKVFISVLGASFYKECVYGQGSFRSSRTRFVQQATLECLMQKEAWTAGDAAYILVTKESKANNWDRSIVERIPPGEGKAVPYTPLEKVFSEMKLPFEVHTVDIPKGLNEEEIWEIFSRLTREGEDAIVREDDALYFDLTHGFRYLPMLVLVLGNYTKFLRNTKVRGIMYGNFETRDSEGMVPIIALLPLTLLQDWTHAISNYLQNGYAEAIKALSMETLLPILRQQQNEQSEDARRMRQLVEKIYQVAEERQLCRGLAVTESKSVNGLREQIGQMNNILIGPFAPLMGKIKDSLKPFSKESTPENMIKAARWCFDNHQYQQATTFLQEGLISIICQRNGITDIKKRELVNWAANIKNSNREAWEEVTKEENCPIVERLLNDEWLGDRDFVNMFFDFNDKVRNDYNHCGMRPEPQKSQVIISKTKAFLEKAETMIGTARKSATPQEREKVFINLSNHPLNEWDNAQQLAAKAYGRLENMAFPIVSPQATDKDIHQLADEWVARIEEKYRDAEIAVHVMGEMTLTYAIVSRLKAVGIVCLASTTRREVKMLEGGRREVVFEFVAFREY